MTAHAPSAVGVAKAPPPLVLFNYIKLQLNPEYQSGHGCPYIPIFPYYLPLALQCLLGRIIAAPPTFNPPFVNMLGGL